MAEKIEYIIDKGHEEPIFGKQCAGCVYLHIRPRKPFSRTTCDAFPDPDNGVPSIILNGEFDHTNPYPGDRGIQFKKRKKK